MKQAIVVGDSVLDHLRLGRVTRQSPEAPDCPVVELEQERWELGGAANVARWLAAVDGLAVTYFGQWPLDDSRTLFERLCGRANVYPNPSLCPNFGLVTTKERLIVREGNRLRHLARVDQDTTMEVGLTEVARTLRRLDNLEIAAIVVADYDKGVFHGAAGRQFALGLSHLARERGVPLIVNSKVIDRWCDMPVSYLLCNRAEFDRSRLAGSHDTLPTEARVVVVTQGERGVCVRFRTTESDETAGFAAHTRQVVDVTGAGDAFLAGLTAERLRAGERDSVWSGSFARGYVQRLVAEGQRWAARCCEQVGVGTPIGGRMEE